MALIVAKFGGTSVADVERIQRAAGKIAREVEAGHQVVVVVSAMSGVTNQLVGYCNDISELHDLYEYDVVVSSGEQVTAGLMAMALHKHGITARSWLGWQIPFKTDEMHSKARVRDIETAGLLEGLKKGEVAVVPGFQGITAAGRISTLGRGGSDTSAVALAAALNADRCDIYTDVDGIYTTDPRIVSSARKLKKISFEEMLELASLGSKVLQTRSVEIAMKHGVSLQVLSSFEDQIGSDMPGTLVVNEEKNMEEELVSGIACKRDEAKITLLRVADVPGIAAKVFSPLGRAGVNVDMIVQNISADGKATDMTFTVSRTDLPRALEALKDIDIEYEEIRSSGNVAKISIVGVGMISHPGVAEKMFTTLAEKNINIHVISTSEIKISVLIEEDYAELAVRALHNAYGLEEAA
ncbi:MAG TPA: aspartate kinase [Alphaproteobacteria bacterium]|nr:aspartate kinase [Alphaproteobacteria bacterium]USO06359.1 MAG: aspartate kinase [Rhodospirillales bacterium]HOO81600.1 aspartate kinase [Alphaproteobacteria bacterium]